VGEAKRGGRVIATHLAETREELQFTEAGTGPWRELLERVSEGFPRDYDCVEASPVAYADQLGLLDCDRALLVHVNYLLDGDLELLAGGRASVVICPRSAAFFGHRGHRWAEMLAAGVNVAVGTDSLASSPDLSILAELHHLHARCPDVSPVTLFQLATTHAARALGLAGEIGALKPGARADLVAWPVSESVPGEPADLLAALIESTPRPRAVLVGSTWQ
jgi:cytosine/adenosine deaminase-related metal-dependent hydrolase